jgi:hypothetical protein
MTLGAGNLNFSTTGQRITGDFGNASPASRPSFQSSAANAFTFVGVAPNGTSRLAGISLANSADLNNTGSVNLFCSDTQATLSSDKIGTGGYVPLAVNVGGAERIKVNTDGAVGIGYSPLAFAAKFVVNGAMALAGQAFFGLNLQYHGGWEYVGAGGGWAFNDFGNGNMSLFGAPPGGTAGATASLTSVMTFEAPSGNIGIGRAVAAGRRLVVQGSDTGTNQSLSVLNGAGVDTFFVRNDGAINTGVGIYNNTTAAAANMTVDGAGWLYRSTSSRRYKRDIVDYPRGLAELRKSRPVMFRAKTKEGAEPNEKLYAGFIAEEEHAAGLTEFVEYNDAGEPDAVNYANKTAHLTRAIFDLEDIVLELRQRIIDLEAAQ